MSGGVNQDRGPGPGVQGPGSGSRHELTLADVDRELGALLAAVPSAGFEARVLQRIDEDAPARRSYVPWLAAAASLVLVAGLFYLLNGGRTSEVVAPQSEVAHHAPVPAAAPAVAAVVTSATPPPASDSPMPAAVRRTPRGDRHARPPVIVPLNQMEAVRRLVRAFNEGRVEAPAASPGGPIAPPAEIVVRPLVVDPIPVPALEPDAENPLPDMRRSY